MFPIDRRYNLAAPPQGVESDFSDGDYAPTIRRLCIALLVFTTIFVSSRVYTRLRITKNFGIDDCCCVFAYCLTTAESALVFAAISYGFGRHNYDIPTSKAKVYTNYFILGLLPGPAYLFIKMAFFLTYARIFSPVPYMRWLLWIGSVITVAFYTGDFLYDIFQCQPIAKAWDPFLKGHCAKEAIAGGPTGIFNVISDTYILLLPLPMVWTLNTNYKKKAKLLIVFSLGIFTVAMSITRLANTIISASDPDHTYAVGPIFIWANLEWSVGLIVASMITGPAFWDHEIHKPVANFYTRMSSAYRSVLSVNDGSKASRNGSHERRADIPKTSTEVQEDKFL